MRAGIFINERARRIRDHPGFLADLERTFLAYDIEALFIRAAAGQVVELSSFHVFSQQDILIAVGGDGTISTTASACVAMGLPLGVIAAGTHNHFARDLDLPMEVEGAVGAIARGKLSPVDVSEVNGHKFINNSSVGAYPRALDHRDGLIQRFGLRKSVAQILATLRVFAQRPLVHAELEIDGEIERTASPFFFIGNNHYKIPPVNARFRESLQEGVLCLFTADRTGLRSFFRLLWLALCNRLEQAGDFHQEFARNVTIRIRRPHVRVSKDGELLRLQPPLRYTIHPKALKVVVP